MNGKDDQLVIRRPRLTVLGTGYLGATHAICMAELGYDVLGVDRDPGRIAKLTAGELPFYEPGLAELLARVQPTGRLQFSTNPRDAADFGDVHFLCVGTPQQPSSLAADTSHLRAAVQELAPHLQRECLVVGKSTVPVGTAGWVADALAELAPGRAHLAWNPEFLREGFAVTDTLRPDRLVFGVHDDYSLTLMEAAYQGVFDLAATEDREVPVVVTDFATAELTKVAANAFLATKISFINAVAELCDATGADVAQLARALGHDARIGHKFLRAGIGFGGGCLPKDVRALRARADELGMAATFRFLADVDEINQRRRLHAVAVTTQLLTEVVPPLLPAAAVTAPRARLHAHAAASTSPPRLCERTPDISAGKRRTLGHSWHRHRLSGAQIAILGATFKPGTDDVRDSPALDIAGQLHDCGADVRIYDPAGMDNARSTLPDVGYAVSAVEAVTGADIVLVLTEWDEFVRADPEELGSVVAHRRVVDGRNCLDAARWRSAGWLYRGMGRP